MRLVSGGRMTCAYIAVRASTAIAAVTNIRFEIPLSQFTTIPICRGNLARLLFASAAARVARLTRSNTRDGFFFFHAGRLCGVTLWSTWD